MLHTMCFRSIDNLLFAKLCLHHNWIVRQNPVYPNLFFVRGTTAELKRFKENARTIGAIAK